LTSGQDGIGGGARSLLDVTSLGPQPLRELDANVLI
jgi:hypothetical protein